jgi:hypothetical protein
MTQQIVIAMIGFGAGIVAALVGVFAKYFFDYRVAKHKLQLEERAGVSAILGPSPSNFIRATRDLYTRLGNFFEDPDRASAWLIGGPTPSKDGYYLREFVRRVFNFVAWGRVTQDAINSLPAAVTAERSDLRRTYVFIDLAGSLLTYTWLFRGIADYEDEQEGFHLFTGTLDEISDTGVRLWKDGEGTITRSAFAQLYEDSEAPTSNLRDLLMAIGKQRAAARPFVVARLATMCALLAAFLVDYAWIISIPCEKEILETLRRNLQYADAARQGKAPVSPVVAQNLSELMDRYHCRLLRL